MLYWFCAYRVQNDEAQHLSMVFLGREGIPTIADNSQGTLKKDRPASSASVGNSYADSAAAVVKHSHHMEKNGHLSVDSTHSAQPHAGATNSTTPALTSTAGGQSPPPPPSETPAINVASVFEADLT